MDEYLTESTIIDKLGAEVIESTDIGSFAVEYATRGFRVFPLKGKVPMIPTAHRQGDPLRGRCKGDCGRVGHGVLDATTDLEIVAGWWSGPAKGANIGLRCPDPVMVIDVDPRNGGLVSLKALTEMFGPIPETLTSISGRGDGGHHRYFLRPAGKVTSKMLGDGIDVKTSAGYVVAPPSIHPDTGKPYLWVDKGAEIAPPPGWLVDLVRPLPPSGSSGQKRQKRQNHGPFRGESVADAFTEATTWSAVLEPHGWRCIDPHGDDDGARWLHPAATSDCSATIRHGCLFIYSDNTPFLPTTAGDPHGYTRFRAWAVLNHGGDLSAAARSFSETGAI